MSLGSSAVTVGGSGRAGASSTPGAKPCFCWPTCAKADVRRTGRRLRHWHPDRVALCQRDRGGLRILLHGPGTDWVRGDTEDVHVPGADLYDEQAVQPLQGHCAVDLEEVGGEHRVCLGVQELPPGRVGVPVRGRGDVQEPAEVLRDRFPLSLSVKDGVRPGVSGPAGQPRTKCSPVSRHCRPSRVPRSPPTWPAPWASWSRTRRLHHGQILHVDGGLTRTGA